MVSHLSVPPEPMFVFVKTKFVLSDPPPIGQTQLIGVPLPVESSPKLWDGPAAAAAVKAIEPTTAIEDEMFIRTSLGRCPV
jgi:hypothetical protein